MLVEILFVILYAIVSIVLYLVLARVLLQATRADRYNPIAQSVVRFTDPFLGPLRRVLPKSARWDVAGILVLVLLSVPYALLAHPARLGLLSFGPVTLFVASVGLLLQTVLSLYMILILVMVVLSFVAPGSYHPGAVLVRQLIDPLLAPIQRFLPSLGGLDFSPFIAGIVLYILRDIVVPKLFF